MRKIWKNNRISLKVKMRLYESVILSTLLYIAELWPLTVTLSKRLDAVHHRWLRSILGFSWKDKATSEEVRARTGQQSILNTLSGRRLRWLGHTIQMDQRRITHQALYWEAPSFKRDPVGQGQTGEA